MNSPPYGQGPRQQFYGPTGQRNSAQCQNQTQGFGHSPFGTSGPNFPVSPGNWNTPPFTQPPPTNARTFNQPPPPCFSPQSQHCPPPRYGRPVNNVWGNPNLYRPNFGPPPRMCPPDARSQQQHGQFGQPGRGRGGGGFGRRGRGRGRGGGKNNQQNGQTHNNKNGNSSNHGQESKKAKTDKRDLPENNQFHCETCDRGFNTDEKYQQHVLEHKKCSVDGCRYVAAPKLVDLHYHTQHRTGLAKKIWSLESPEDIQKWIQERKRHFPTKENIARRAADIAERRSRGEKIDTKQFGKMRGRGRGRRGQHGRQRHWENDQPQRSSSQERTGSLDSQPDANKGDKSDRLNHSEGNKPGPSQSASSPSSAISDQSAEFCDRGDQAESTQSAASQKRTNHKRPRDKKDEHKSDSLTSPSAAKKSRADENRCVEDSAGIKTDKTSGADLDPLSLLIKDEDGMSEEDEDEDDVKPQMLKGKALASLISSYGSDDSKAEADDTDEDDKDEEKRKHDAESGLPTKPSAQLSTHPSTKASSKDSRELRQTNRPQSGAKDQSKKQKQQQQRRQHKPSRKPTLLEMLLAKEIRHERNVIMQCVHYIVKNKFLGVCDGKE
ncbi:FMR1-interacting protein NUFIP1-like [Littorina saxatilis]|uniref:C2H2-type domain-containing protein n=1 Tax=Littorina saxatilis TaxID=31220 RepID=A0AAN9G021_9CAEN